MDSPCEEGDGWLNRDGYHLIGLNGKNVLQHRLIWTLWNGPIPDGLEVCHICNHPGCINIEHLFLGTHQENIQDAASKGRMANQKKTHCPKGHEYMPENTYLYPDGRRECRLCQRVNRRKSRSRAKGY